MSDYPPQITWTQGDEFDYDLELVLVTLQEFERGENTHVEVSRTVEYFKEKWRPK